ncbi:hypothetical protein PI87_20150 [Ralstonia sp. A12]|uniref:hypothetical protein n=1 Tax=Ralstonia sp. A12 TaxID=1217052 RepID=UPI0005731D6B|nr:hypothetical protein [Ralstonia sp. A12]KHK51869.1 hypothetical protein PI87_20150 [Ralstonia sp. A12]
MPLPFHIGCTTSQPSLFALSDGRFQLLTNHPIGPFLAGYAYFLVEERFAAFLQRVGVERIKYSPAVLFDSVTGTELQTHVLLTVGQLFAPDHIQDLDLVGPRLLVMNNQHYFASPTLRALLEAEGFEYLTFSEGLSKFAAVQSPSDLG